MESIYWKKPTTEQWKQYVKEVTNDEYECLSDYKSCKDRVTMKHLVCGTIYEVTPDRFKAGNRCINKECLYKRKKPRNVTQEDFERRVREKLGPRYIILSKYTTCHNKVKVRHEVCGTEYEVKAGHLLYDNNRCPYCSKRKTESDGEAIIRRWLTARNINFIQEYTGFNLYNKKKLSFDFYINHNDKIKLIEFDGEFHFKPFYENDDSDLISQQQRDEIKNEFCKKNNYDLLRINYKEVDEIPRILNEFLKDLI